MTRRRVNVALIGVHWLFTNIERVNI